MSAFGRPLLRRKQQTRSYLVHGARGQHSFLSVSSSPEGRSTRCSWSSVWRRPCVSTNASVESSEAVVIQQVWEEYFADPSQWWDNRVSKITADAPDFEHKVTKRPLSVDCLSTPLWVKAALKLGAQSIPPFVGHIRDYQEILYSNRVPKSNSGERNTLPSSAKESEGAFEYLTEKSNIQRAKTVSEAIDVLKDRLQQGVAVYSSTYYGLLKRCLKQEDLAAVKQVHECIIESGMQQNVYVANNLLSAYLRCGRLEDACRVFDELVEKDLLSWTRMIGAYAQHNLAEDAMGVFNRMLQEGVRPDAVTYLSLLKAFSSPSDLIWGKEVHASIRQYNFESDARVGTALVKMYTMCGSTEEAREIFDKLASHDIKSWNVMIVAYAEKGCVEDACRLLAQMRREGVKPDSTLCTSILLAGESAGALKWVKEVHGLVLEAGLASDVHLGNELVRAYGKCGSVDDARLFFGRMKQRNAKTWTVMIGGLAKQGCEREAFEYFLQMNAQGFKPDVITYLNILHACARAGSLEWVKEVHSLASELGFDLDIRVGSALVHIYAKSGSLDEARRVFDRMQERDVITWTVMIGGLAQGGRGREAYDLFVRMQAEGFKPDAVTYMSILNASASPGALEWVKEVHSHARGSGFESDVRVGNAIVHMYAKCDSVDDARLFFDRMEKRDVITWNSIIGAYARTGCGEEAYRLLLEMKQEGFKPDVVTYVSFLKACASAGNLDWVREVHSEASIAGLDSDVSVGNSLVHTYAKCGSIDDARRVFDGMKKRDYITWNVVIGAYAASGLGKEAYRLLVQMEQEGFVPDAVTYLTILNACASTGALEWLKKVHSQVVAAGLQSHVRVGNSLIHMYAKCGSIDNARQVFHSMKERELITWNVMIGSLAQHGCGSEALQLFKDMTSANVIPDEYSFVALLSACSHAGLVDEGRELFTAMSQEYGLVPNVLHWNCMVDILARAGLLENAKLIIDNMPVAPDAATWGALLSGCRSYGHVELGEVAAKECFKLEPKEASNYVLLSNIYAAAEKWEDVFLLRIMMQERGVSKDPGSSWIEVGDKVHTFVVGDTSHPKTSEIYAELSRLTERIKERGYLPDTRPVLQDVSEAGKELSLCSHSERLAIAYGLLTMPLSSGTIRVYKNLRVCSDCHVATKLITKVTRREIVVRDLNRFHHFKDGSCSCNDYW